MTDEPVWSDRARELVTELGDDRDHLTITDLDRFLELREYVQRLLASAPSIRAAIPRVCDANGVCQQRWLERELVDAQRAAAVLNAWTERVGLTAISIANLAGTTFVENANGLVEWID